MAMRPFGQSTDEWVEPTPERAHAMRPYTTLGGGRNDVGGLYQGVFVYQLARAFVEG